MAGSYGHVTDDDGAFIGADLLENGGDVFEAVEEMYGMIWYLANGDPNRVKEAQANWNKGFDLAPPRKDDEDEEGEDDEE